MLDIESFIAGNRFGFGIGPKDYAKVAGAPQSWVSKQLDAVLDQSFLINLKSSASLTQEILKLRKSDDKDKNKKIRQYARSVYKEELTARTLQAVNSNTPFLERLTHFWSNHFAVSIKRREVVHLVGAYEREAIRPNILGKFSDLLLAAESHPAMLLYLDNASSIGPNSKVGLNRDKGLNENLAREILELHSLGVNGGYRQDDVVALAKLLTGWTVSNRGVDAGKFHFAKNRHEPGPIRFLDKKYSNSWQTRGKIALKDVALHPATAKFISKKLVTYFVSEKAPKELFRAVEQKFINSDGDLKEVYQTLLSFDEVWQNKYEKIKSNSDLVISIGKLINNNELLSNKVFQTSYKFLGREPFAAPAPTGYSNLNKDQVSPDIISRRIELASLVAKRIKFNREAEELLDISLGNVVSDKTREAIANSNNSQEAYALLMACPEFQRR